MAELMYAIIDSPTQEKETIANMICIAWAGFRTETHFQSFHAFMFTWILTMTEMLQFICQLRYVMQDLPPDAVHESYIFIQKSMGTSVDYVKVNREFE